MAIVSLSSDYSNLHCLICSISIFIVRMIIIFHIKVTKATFKFQPKFQCKVPHIKATNVNVKVTFKFQPKTLNFTSHASTNLKATSKPPMSMPKSHSNSTQNLKFPKQQQIPKLPRSDQCHAYCYLDHLTSEISTTQYKLAKKVIW